ncbi:S-layer homology domain-containing protein [Intestinimonas sp. MSJ-38]|uniref:S-layer homology domain-containing protein n=1 Tax=Intestinimonas sp. MSJ-38 TaxID=2841532 RepID=UPI001C0FEBD0|nr:S-layer homology domain-containing protein [Intestinimonas sp. MSJ-38]MBU5433266.1 S-layer homology domain-containing protein [Intestinimonas sp. MSJ-38]
MKKRVLSLFMALTLCFSMLPTAALAEEAGAAPGGGEVGTHTAHCVCGKDSSTMVNGHTHSTNTAWEATDALPNSAGSYYLTQSVTADWTVPTGEVNLCLNGQTINGKITVGSGATLTLTDCSSDNSGKVQGEVLVNGGKFELYSGTITGGVQVGLHSRPATGSSFTMYGGTISGNTDTGGVFLVGTTNHTDPPNFTMHGGTISDNTAGASDGGGGGVYVGENCSFTMDGGTITGNTATAGNGGGIYIHMLANVTISGGEITNNKAPATGDISHGHGGGIYSQSGVTVKNVTITGNNSNFEGGGIYGKGTINLTDATVTGNNRYDVYYDGEEKTTPKLTVSGSVEAGYYANYDWKLPIRVSGALSEDSVIHVGVREKPGYGSKVTIAEPASGVTLSAKNFKADAADCVTSLGSDGKVYLARCAHVMDSTGYTCEKCKTQFDARVGESAYYQTLAETFLKAWNGSTITLLRDVTLTGNCSASNTILDLNGKTITSGDKFFNVNEKLTVKDSSEGGGTQALNVKFSVSSNGTLAVDNSYTGEISRVELQAGGALEAYTGTIQELLLGKGNGTGYSVKLWKGNARCCTVKTITLDKKANQDLTVGGLLKTNHAKCELYGEEDGTWSIVPKTEKISELTGYTAYKVQFQECVHQCADDTVEKPVCSKCGKALVVKITATASDDKTKTAWFPADSGIENGDGYVEAIQTLNGWSAEGYTDATLMPLCDVHNNSGGIGIANVTLTGKLTVDGGKHLIYSTTIASDADVTFKTGQFYYITVNGKASFVDGTYLGGVTASSGAEAVFSGGAYQHLKVEDGGTAVVKNSAAFGEDVKVTKGTLTVEGGSFKAAVVVEGDGTMNVNGGRFTGTGIDKVKYDNGAKGTVSGGSFADLYLYSSGTAWLAGGSFAKLSTADSGVLSSLLADGAAYYDQSGNAISGSTVSELNNVTVKTHAHTVDEQTGICSVCGKQMAASLTVGNETSWYLTLDAAIKAANEGTGEKTLKLYQDVPTTAPSYELTRGPVTLDVNGKKAFGLIITVKGIQLTVTGEGTIGGVTASGSSAVVKNSTVEIKYITAENGGRLELGGGLYMGLAVKNDGSSASLSGGTYNKIEWGKSYVPANEYLADGYGYKTSAGTWEDGAASVKDVTVTPAPIKSTKVYPNSETGYSGSTFDAKDSTSVTLTVSVTSDESASLSYIWCRSINDEWRWLTNPSITQDLTEKYTGADSKTLSITGLPAGQTFSYKVRIATSDGYKCYSEPFTVTRHQHSWTYSAEGAAITANCTAEGCYLAGGNGGSVTIKAPDESTLTYTGKGHPAKLDGQFTTGISTPAITYIQTAPTQQTLENGALPTNAGTYTASITLGGVTASVGYEITKVAPKIASWSPYTMALPAYNGEQVKNPTTLPMMFGKFSDITGFKWYQATKNEDSSYTKGKELSAPPTDAGDYYIEAIFKAGTNTTAGIEGTGLTVKPMQTEKVVNAKEYPVYANRVYTYEIDLNSYLTDLKLGTGVTYTKTNGDLPSYFKAGELSITSDGKLTVPVKKTTTAPLPSTIATIVVWVKSSNYDRITLSVPIQMVAKKSENLAVGMTGWTYGESANGPEFSAPEGVTATVTYAVKGSGVFNATVPTNAGEYTVKVQYETNDNIYTGTADFIIKPKNISGVTINLGQQATYNGSEQDVAISSVMDGSYSLMAGDHDYAVVSGNKATNVGENTLVIEGQGNYTGTARKTWSLDAKEVTLNWGNITDRKWNDGKTVTATVSNKVGSDEVDVTVTGGDQTAVGGLHTATAAGLTGAQADNYKLPADKARTYSIGKADACKLLDITVSQKQSVTTEQSKDIGRAGMPDDAGKLTYAKGSESKTGTVTIDSWSVDTTGKVTYKLSGGATNDTVTLPVTIGSDNYADSTVNVVITLTDKDIPTVTAKDITVTYDGNAIPDSKITGTANVAGTWEWKSGMAVTNVVDSGNKTVVFKPTDSANYVEVEKNIKVTINKATPTGEPAYTKITTGGKKLSDAALAIGTITPAGGTITWDKAGTTEVTANTAYGWTYTPTDAANYNKLTGSITPYVVSSSGGGFSSGSTVKTDTVTNPDGSVTKTETKSDGTVVETTTGKDGSVSKTTTNPNGSSVTESKDAAGSTGTVKTDKNGQTTAETTLSGKAVEDAKKNGEPVTAPVEVEATRNSNTAPTVKVELPRNSGDTKVEIPVSNVKPGTVAVLVHADGTEEIVKNSVPTADGIQLTVNGGATVKIVDNSKDFIDTQDHWAKDAIDFVSARGLVNGMSATIYAPDASTTRAQLWTILARQNNADLNGGATWFENAQNWAKEKGISDGTNPNGTISRAQMVTMLWRAAGSPAQKATTRRFSDIMDDSYYADAVAWAVENGITAGVGNGRFDPNSTCTRGQIATFLYRLYLSR